MFTDGKMDKLDVLKNCKNEEIRDMFRLIDESKVKLCMVDTKGM